MAQSVAERLETLGISIPKPFAPVANYLGAKISGSILFVSGHVSSLKGAVGTDVTVDQAREGAREAALLALGTALGVVEDLDRIASVEKLNGYVRSAPDFTQQPAVINGASDLLVEVFGDAGRHSRAAVGVAQLPTGASVEVEMVLRLRDARGAA